ncbi:MAG: hypothetical protein QXK87_00605 [Fervidicoccaceae archaeon]
MRLKKGISQTLLIGIVVVLIIIIAIAAVSLTRKPAETTTDNYSEDKDSRSL